MLNMRETTARTSYINRSPHKYGRNFSLNTETSDVTVNGRFSPSALNCQHAARVLSSVSPTLLTALTFMYCQTTVTI
jgi:hypothetical protein